MKEKNQTKTARILCVSGSAELRDRLKRLLTISPCVVAHEPGLDHALERCEKQAYDLIVLTGMVLRAQNEDAAELLGVIHAHHPDTRIILLAEDRDVRKVKSFSESVSYTQYAQLPIGDEPLRQMVESTLASKKPADAQGISLPASSGVFEEIIGQSDIIRQTIRLLRQAASTDMPVLLTGETGTGKDVSAECIHRMSGRHHGPFVPVHLGAYPSGLAAGELFGYEKGAFTGAVQSQTGRFDEAENGTIFLDEVGTADEKVQITLLRVLERKAYRRLGGKRAIRTNTRIIAATNENLEMAVANGMFRQDLYYRLDVFRVHMPALRERQGDIPLLVDHFVKRYNRQFGKTVAGIAPECIALLEAFDWPGNVRELKNVIQRASLVCQGEVILPEHLPPRFRPDQTPRMKITFDIDTPLRDVEREMIARVLNTVRNNKTKAADMLGISRRALYNKMQRYGL